jgi:hypothetical protein
MIDHRQRFARCRRGGGRGERQRGRDRRCSVRLVGTGSSGLACPKH